MFAPVLGHLFISFICISLPQEATLEIARFEELFLTFQKCVRTEQEKQNTKKYLLFVVVVVVCVSALAGGGFCWICQCSAGYARVVTQNTVSSTLASDE